jgi:hypothetical protein
MGEVHARRAMAHHFEAFPLGFEAYEAPRQALRAALLGAAVPEDRFIAPKPGQSLRIVPAAP